MKKLIYAMQSSGASLYTFFLAQKQNTIGIIDLNNHRLAPPITANFDIVLKCVITTRWTLNQHIESFKPDKSVLFLRDPCQTYLSLKDRAYANKSGLIDEKFRILDKMYVESHQFDEVVYYEEFVQKNQGFVLARSKEEIKKFNESQSEWCKLNPGAPGEKGGAGFGNVHGSKISVIDNAPVKNVAISNRVQKLCPHLFHYYHDK